MEKKYSFPIIFLIVLVIISTKSIAQKELPIIEEIFTKAIEDNSLFLEEAFNQDDRVAQVIQSLVIFNNPTKSYEYLLTNEWPVFGLHHQLSFTLPYTSISGLSGFGDIMLNYRYQLTHREDWAILAPRVSAILPTGRIGKGFDSGNFGLQLAMAGSKRLNNSFQLHANLGMTSIFNQRNYDISTDNEFRKSVNHFFGGFALNYIASENINLSLEYFTTYSQIYDTPDIGYHTLETIICPGIRYAINIGETQIVPSIAVPFKIDDAEHKWDIGLMFYFSVEFPY